jgi:integrase
MKNITEFEKLAKDTKDKVLSFGITSRTVLKYFDRCVRLLNQFLDTYQLEFNLEIGIDWLNQLKFNQKSSDYNVRLAYRRTILLLWDQKNSNLTEWRVYPSTKQSFPKGTEFQDTLHNYRKYLEQALYAEATIDFRVRCAKSLLIFMESKQVYSLQGITHVLISEYFTTDHFSDRKPSGVQAEAVRAKLFLEYLEEEKFVEDQTLHCAVPIYYTQQEKIITTITPEAEKQLLDDYPHLPSNKRGKSMFLLALRLGMRTSDIFNLKFENIDWENSVLSILQKKTNQPLKMKLDNETQNALIDYILNERRNTSLPFIFITTNGPIKKLTRYSISTSNKRITGLDIKKNIPHQGLHILRRTFASRLLNNGAPLAVISSALGHTEKNQVHKYLSTNEEKMRLCALSLSSIPFGRSEF